MENENNNKTATPKKTPFMKRLETKLERSAKACSPEALETAQTLLENFSPAEVIALSAHASDLARLNLTEASVGKKVTVGARVQCISGDPKYHLLKGTVLESRNIRTLVRFAEFKRPAYLLQADIAVLDSE